MILKKVLVDCRYNERAWNVGSLAMHVVRKKSTVLEKVKTLDMGLKRQ